MKKLSRRRARFAILAFWGGMALVIAGGCMSQFTVFELGLAAVVAGICAIASFELLRATRAADRKSLYAATALCAAAIPLAVWGGAGGRSGPPGGAGADMRDLLRGHLRL